jgi:uncharacterized membrane protein
MTKKSIFGLDENIAGVVSYVFAFFSGIVVLVMEKENKFVRFHALQSTIWFLFLCIVSWVLGILSGIPLLGILISIVRSLVGLVSFVSWAYLMFMAYKGSLFKLPIIGDVVWNQINK